MANKKKSEKQTQKSGLAFLLWLIAAIILLVLFLVNQNKIISNLKSTDFFNRVSGKTPAFVQNATLSPSSENEKNDVDPLAPINIDFDDGLESNDTQTGVTFQNEAAKRSYEEALEENRLKMENLNSENNLNSESFFEQDDFSSGTNVATATVKSGSATSRPVPGAVMNIKLFFMTINSDGSVSRKEVTREMQKTDSPLVDAINALIIGPTAEEEDLGYRSLVSNGTRLLSANVKNGVATLNFSGEFERNQWGIEGTRGQLQQIVYTATAFPTVESVQFLVDGELREFLSSEGVWIGTPLNRNSF